MRHVHVWDVRQPQILAPRRDQLADPPGVPGGAVDSSTMTSLPRITAASATAALVMWLGSAQVRLRSLVNGVGTAITNTSAGGISRCTRNRPIATAPLTATDKPGLGERGLAPVDGIDDVRVDVNADHLLSPQRFSRRSRRYSFTEI